MRSAGIACDDRDVEPRTSFVGRDDEITEICGHVRATQLVTLVGPGGIGKTRLAHRVATALEDEATDGIHIVELAGIATGSSPAEVGDLVASTIGMPTLAATWESLHDATTLIVIDNCEHVLDSVAEIVDQLLDDRPELRILLTSREPLDLDGEQIVTIGPLHPVATAELLRQRAESAGATLDPGTDAVRALDALSAVLDGLPLAIELAAPRLRSLAADDIRAELTESSDLLARNRGEARHRSVAATVAWSYELLTEEEARAFRHACVFPAGFWLDEMAAVLADDTPRSVLADRLDRLVAQSLVRVESGEGRPRYRMLVPVRQAARAWAEEEDEFEQARERAMDHIASVAAGFLARAADGWDDALITDIFSRLPDLRAVGEWCLEHDTRPDRAFMLFLPLWASVHNSHIAATLRHGEALLARWPDRSLDWWPEVCALTATAALAAGDVDRARELAETTLAARMNPGLGAVVAQRVLALGHAAEGEFDKAAAAARAGATAARDLGQTSFERHLENHRAAALLNAGDNTSARSIASAIDEHARASTTSALSGPALQIIAESHLDDDTTAGHQALDAIADVVDSPDLLAGRWSAARVRGQLHLRDADPTAALEALREALIAARRAGERRDQWHAMRWIGVTLALHHAEHLATAATILEAVERCPASPAAGTPGRDLLEAAIGLVTVRPTVVPSEPSVINLAIDTIDAVLDSTPDDRAGSVTDPPVARLTIGDAGAEISWSGITAGVPSVKGLRDIATMLAEPRTDFHALTLMGSTIDEPGTGPLIDQQARRDYEDRLRDLHADIADAEHHNDIGRLERAQAEFDEIVATLSAALGLGGRDRKAGAAAEKARSAVTWRIRAAIKKVEEAHPAAGRHLRNAVKTGGFCRYDPETDAVWIVDT